MKLSIPAVITLVSSCLLHAETLQSVLARIDKAAPSIHAMTSNVQMITYTQILDDRVTESGTLRMQKLSPTDLRAIIEFTGGKDARTVALLGKYAEIYYPRLKSYQRIDIGKKAAAANQLLLLGFGSSGSDLAKSYDMQVVGSEKVQGLDTTKLELVPRDPDLRKNHLDKVDLWIPLAAGYPIQQQFFDPGGTGNWRQVSYTDINIQPNITGTLDLKLPKGTQLQKDND